MRIVEVTSTSFPFWEIMSNDANSILCIIRTVMLLLMGLLLRTLNLKPEASEGKCGGEVAPNSWFLMVSQNENDVNVTLNIFSLTLQKRFKIFADERCPLVS